MRSFVALTALALAASAQSHPVPCGMTRRGGNLDKFLIASSPAEAAAYFSHRDEFVASIDYSATATDSKLLVTLAPMLSMSESASSFIDRAETAIKAGAQFLLGPNEPNGSGGSSASSVANHWEQAIQVLLDKYPHVKGVSPSVSSAKNYATYLAEFKKHCKHCKIDAFGLHFYNQDGVSNAQGVSKLTSYIDGAQQLLGGGATFMITEFGSRSSSASTKAGFIKAATQLMRGRHDVIAAGAFPHLRGFEFVKNGKLTALGLAWVNA